MRYTEIYDKVLNESYYRLVHPTGVTIYVYPKPENKGAYAVFGTKCGSIDDNFRPYGRDEFVKVPAGIAHFLEHKLFENEDCDAFEQYAKTGANANAYTSFDRTCYLFSCTENFSESFEILLGFVQSPYFTEQTVSKEQGIIGQEIKMYDDRPSWQVFFNLLQAMYKEHPIRLDIGGTVESIAQITPQMLSECYDAFYHPSNMIIAVAGNVDKDEVLEIADRLLKPSDKRNPERCMPDEPSDVCTTLVEKYMDVGITEFQLGFKENGARNTLADQITATIAINSVMADYTDFYRSMLDDGLINRTFSAECFCLRGMAAEIISGESNQPNEVKKRIIDELNRVKKEGIDPELFECAKRDCYGKQISIMSRNESICSMLLEMFFAEDESFNALDFITNLTIESVQSFLDSHFCEERCSLSVVYPKSQNKEEAQA